MIDCKFIGLLIELRPIQAVWKVVIFLAYVKVRDSESFEQSFRTFKKSCEKAGILSEVKKREHYEKPSIRLKKKSIAARKRMAKEVSKRF